MGNSEIIKLIILAVYLLAMLAVGFLTFKQNEGFEDYVLGGRKLGKWATALSAQASDMSGWLLVGLPGAAYLAGVEAGWIAIGLGIGTYANWKVLAKRLRIYTEKAGNSLTLPEYFEARFEDHSGILRLIPALVIIIFFTVYTAAQFSTGAKLFEMLLHVPYQVALVIGAIVIIGYTFLGGFLAVSLTDVIQGMLMFFALLVVPVYAVVQMGGVETITEGVLGIDPNFLSLTKATGGGMVPLMSIITNLAWGLGYFGQPHILARFMAINDPDELKHSRRIAIVWVAITLVASVICGVIGRLYFINSPLADSEQVFMLMVDQMFPAVLAGIFLAAILAASMSTADSQLLVTAASVSEDIYNQYIDKKADDKKKLLVGRLSVIAIAVIGVMIAFDPDSSVFGLVSNAWAGLGASFGPVVITSVFWKRMNRYGAMAGMIGGAVMVLAWNMLEKMFADITIFQLYELLPAFIVSLLLIFIVSNATKEPSEEMYRIFDEVKASSRN
ncbi:sodium/proline symporter PutP [Anaerotignum faecicola]|nr:sodium/proline symporter PutP [Anaerotignum faecicola]